MTNQDAIDILEDIRQWVNSGDVRLDQITKRSMINRAIVMAQIALKRSSIAKDTQSIKAKTRKKIKSKRKEPEKKEIIIPALPIDWGKVKSLQNAGWSIDNIADEFRMSEAEMKQKIKEHEESEK